MKLYAFLVAALLVASSQTAVAQGQGASNDVHLGLGVGTRFFGGIPLGVSYDHALDKEFTVGGYVGYQRYSRSLSFAGFSGGDYNVNIINIGPRATYHPNIDLDLNNDQIDLYAGATLGFSIVTSNFDDVYGSVNVFGFNPVRSRLLYGLFIGGTYNFTELIGVYAEVGYGLSILNAGLNFNL